MKNYNKKDGQSLKFEVHGYEMDDGYNLFYVNQALSDFHSIIDKAYLALFDRGKMLERDREILQVKLMSVEKGSFIADLDIYIASATQLALSFGAPLTPSGIWEIIIQAYDFLKFALEANQKGNQIEIREGDGDGNMITVVTGDNNNINVYPQTLVLAGNAAADFQRINNNINKEKGIDSISIGGRATELIREIEFDENSKKLLQSSKHTLKNPVEVIAQIYRLDGHSLSGRLKVMDSHDKDIENGKEFSFKILDSDEGEAKNTLKLCVDSFMKGAQITALKVMEFSPTNLKLSLNKFIIISVDKIFP